MTICNRLKDIIHDDAQISLKHSEYNNTSGSLMIKEPDKTAKCKQVKLTGLSADNTFACKLDCEKIQCGNKGHKLSPYFKDAKGLDKGCDAIIITKIQSQ